MSVYGVGVVMVIGVQNAIDLAHALGAEEVRVAILSAMKAINPKVPSRTEAAAPCNTASYVMQPRSLALLVEQEIQ